MKASELKASLLQLAVSGKLVRQDPHDEPASVLLNRIKKEREALLKAGKIKEGKPLSPVSEEEKPFSIPASWEWVRLGDICEYIHRGKSPIYSYIKEIPVVAQKCIQWSGIQMDKALFIDPDSFNKYTEERYLRTNDLLWNSTGLGTLGRIGIYDERLTPYKFAVADSHVTVIRPIKNQINSLYLYSWFAGPSVQNTINDKSTGSTKQTELATQTIKEHIVPLPPLAEQQRIVARIEELMPLIEAYNREEQKLTALEAEFPGALRQSILQYAVQGKLVSQKAEDGTAAELLAHIKKEREALVKEGKIRKGKPLSPVSEEEKPFEIPASWEWVRLGDICEYIHRGKSPIYSCIKEIPVVAQKCIQWSGIQMDKALFIDPDSFNKYTEERYLRTNDLLWNSTGLGTLGRIGIYDERLTPYQIAVADSHVTVIRPIKSQIDSLYLYYWFAGPSVQNTINDKSTGSTKQTELATQTIKEHIVPLPPLAEQHRIVERIEELMELCDRIPLHGK